MWGDRLLQCVVVDTCCSAQAKEEEERRAAEFASLKASLAAGDKLEAAAAEQLVRYLLDEFAGNAAKVSSRAAAARCCHSSVIMLSRI